ncbi:MULTISPECIES: pyrroloquinoline quinone biosynthesis peptide chaperone PqqD [Erwinia]|uniref:PqqA binding protein n=1 Tax=Erwinia pyrifoliae TaxID=79967 RepID=A0ABY5X6D4_ERWPY|nr:MULTISPECIES: pyrroloquinoline quinone biosynthesis peptide chaperone PqqD [Erwinia]ADP10209.1 Coenzyme PQQ synthesis protein D (Pyrroloquinoline quinone biosynthesis protein D) [Erwinia sp. Ejp617]AUX73835.1 pyrroloquinoline quinone biosynthesis peptide chaperone PqqD [Erwinia pyrifoliae]MCA8875837.1 pyrroloquinoline quinone biosynthesis peptide chaperone PqqD [Erwinia pyrifoliae]MCT2387633.1 pyrroloquinoline quinone biosynthesis peptide chaperone PqqD [Erwinia pyrifoliae]MCU8585889.1 pyrr
MSLGQTIPVFRRGYRLQWEEVQNCHVILYPEGMAKLNDSATMILELVDGKRSLAEIVLALNTRFPGAGGVDDDVTDFFAAAREQKWIIFREPL